MGRAKNQAKVRQKDTDATWTKKYSRSFFGYKDHVKVDASSKLIADYDVTTASVHDSQVFKTLITRGDAGATVWADSAYQGTEYLVHSVGAKVEYEVHEKAYKNCPLTEEQKAENRKRSKTRRESGTCFWVYGELDGLGMRLLDYWQNADSRSASE